MRVKQSKSKNTINYAIIKDIKVGNKRTSTIVENLGNHNTRDFDSCEVKNSS
ncbi:Transposase-like protein [Streptococcus pneumoniae]|nr:Transposase-like protein [Streptococcus pneumoniae]